jgi:hypothetical protein
LWAAAAAVGLEAGQQAKFLIFGDCCNGLLAQLLCKDFLGLLLQLVRFLVDSMQQQMWFEFWWLGRFLEGKGDLGLVAGVSTAGAYQDKLRRLGDRETLGSTPYPGFRGSLD